MLISMDSKANILIDKDGRARLTDFGLTSIIRGEYSVASLQEASETTTTTWAAPEILKGGPVTKEGDVFTFAMAAVEVHTRVSNGNFSTYLPSIRYSKDVPLSLASIPVYLI
jgi:serine/threonine protein kinase